MEISKLTNKLSVKPAATLRLALLMLASTICAFAGGGI